MTYALTVISGGHAHSIDAAYFHERFWSQRQYENLLACYRSGQISERQWHEHLKDEASAAWIASLSGEHHEN